MDIAVDQIKTLRDLTGAGIMDCKRALQDTDGDISDAEKLLKVRGISKVEAKSDRETQQGLVEAYIHSGSRVGAIIELNCETDFVARLPEFKELAHILSMQVVAMSPVYIDRSEITDDDRENSEDLCLLQQPCIKDNTKVIQDLITELAARVGESIRVRRFERFAIGE